MTILPCEKDAIGHAVTDYLNTGKESQIRVISDIAADDVIPVSYLFRSEKQMPLIERKALELCTGNVLDVGAGAGCHSLILQNAGIGVDALEISGLCCRVMKKRGIQQVVHADLFSLRGHTYDIILMLMNGIGIVGDLSGMHAFLSLIGDLLSPQGFVLFDSSDLSYLFRDDDATPKHPEQEYFGELQYQMIYKNVRTDYFKWLFIDFETMNSMAEKYGYEALLLAEGPHYDYLGMLRKKI